MATFKPSKTQQKVIDQIAEQGYILERHLAKPTRAALWTAGIIYFDTVDTQSKPDARGYVWRIRGDAYLLTDKGKTYVTVKSEETAK